jgi:DNA-binding transcriptional regulator YdaS (Cro superfamily)
MTLNDAIAHYDGNQAALAAAIGYTPASVTNWLKRGGHIPMVAQLRIQKATKGRLKADPITEKKSA